MIVYLANPRGFCAGVDRAILIVETALEKFGAPIYVRHEVVHNRYVVNNLKQKGAIFVEELTEVPDDATVIFSAHGVSQAVRKEAAGRALSVFDATCPLVTKVHMEVARHAKSARECVLIGHKGHPEVEGTLGQYHSRVGNKIYLVENIEEVEALQVQKPDALAYVTQTTLSVDETKDIIAALKVKFPNIIGPRKDDICYATQNRQDAVKILAQGCDVMLVVGSTNSSNSNRLRELAEKQGVKAYLLDCVEQIDPAWFTKECTVGITAGASAPEILVKQIIGYLEEHWEAEVSELAGKAEDVVFSLPGILRVHQADTA